MRARICASATGGRGKNRTGEERKRIRTDLSHGVSNYSPGECRSRAKSDERRAGALARGCYTALLQTFMTPLQHRSYLAMLPRHLPAAYYDVP